MNRHRPSRARSTSHGWRIAALVAVAGTLSPGIPASAQTRSARDTATAYGARLNAKGEPANLNPSRINDRVNSRLDTRLSLRVERYRPDNTNDPTAAFAVHPADNARIGTDTTLSPLSISTSTSLSQAYDEAPAPGRTNAAARSR